VIVRDEVERVHEGPMIAALAPKVVAVGVVTAGAVAQSE
jgi:hypothetical protein